MLDNDGEGSCVSNRDIDLTALDNDGESSCVSNRDIDLTALYVAFGG